MSAKDVITDWLASVQRKYPNAVIRFDAEVGGKQVGQGYYVSDTNYYVSVQDSAGGDHKTEPKEVMSAQGAKDGQLAFLQKQAEHRNLKVQINENRNDFACGVILGGVYTVNFSIDRLKLSATKTEVIGAPHLIEKKMKFVHDLTVFNVLDLAMPMARKFTQSGDVVSFTTSTLGEVAIHERGFGHSLVFKVNGLEVSIGPIPARVASNIWQLAKTNDELVGMWAQEAAKCK